MLVMITCKSATLGGLGVAYSGHQSPQAPSEQVSASFHEKPFQEDRTTSGSHKQCSTTRTSVILSLPVKWVGIIKVLRLDVSPDALDLYLAVALPD